MIYQMYDPLSRVKQPFPSSRYPQAFIFPFLDTSTDPVVDQILNFLAEGQLKHNTCYALKTVNPLLRYTISDMDVVDRNTLEDATIIGNQSPAADPSLETATNSPQANDNIDEDGRQIYKIYQFHNYHRANELNSDEIIHSQSNAVINGPQTDSPRTRRTCITFSMEYIVIFSWADQPAGTGMNRDMYCWDRERGSRCQKGMTWQCRYINRPGTLWMSRHYIYEPAMTRADKRAVQTGGTTAGISWECTVNMEVQISDGNTHDLAMASDAD
ncbi:hypothetical protein BYT27DRAFT_7284596 [Phlegmacium glaucopus]|nr:hypothetical protein BYT27DRAFT_7284596 [Phlegmacium glaucopus]